MKECHRSTLDAFDQNRFVNPFGFGCLNFVLSCFNQFTNEAMLTKSRK